MHKAVFLDKDGTLIPDIPYNVNPALITLQEGVLEGLSVLQQQFLLIIISNQSGIALGYFVEQEIEGVKNTITLLLEAGGVRLGGFYYCPHFKEGTVKEYAVDCSCRKPKPGMLIEAAAHFGIDLSQSWMIGDILHDVEAGNAAGCRSILIDNGNETEWHMNSNRQPCFIARTMLEAAHYILNETRQ